MNGIHVIMAESMTRQDEVNPHSDLLPQRAHLACLGFPALVLKEKFSLKYNKAKLQSR